MFQVTENSITINTFEDLEAFQDTYGLFSESVFTLSVTTLKKIKEIAQLTNDEEFPAYVHYSYSVLFAELIFKTPNVSEFINSSKITEDLNGKLLTINIVSNSPISFLLIK